MSVSPAEQLPVITGVQAEQTTDVDDESLVFAAIEQHFGNNGERLLHFTTEERRDYTGDASHKVRFGGALVVICSVLAEGAFMQRKIEINDAYRPFDEETITRLGANAPVVFRDIFLHE